LFKSKSSTIKNQQGTDDDDDNSSAMRVEPKQISPRGPTALSLPPPLEDSESEQQPLDDDFAGGASTLQEEEEDLQQPEQFHQQFELDSTPSDGEEPMLGSMGDGEWDGDGVFKPPEFSEEFISSIFGTFFLGVGGAVHFCLFGLLLETH
jgi:hypothetical protein